VPERPRAHHADAAATALRVVLFATAFLAPLVAAGCAEDAGGDAASETATATTTVTETMAETVTETVTETVVEDTADPGAPAPTEATRTVVRFGGNGDRTLPPVQARRRGAMLRWRNDGEVFSLFSQDGIIVDSVGRRGETFLPAGRHLLEIVASGDWRIEIENARRAR
jgi:hypothetical protein